MAKRARVVLWVRVTKLATPDASRMATTYAWIWVCGVARALVARPTGALRGVSLFSAPNAHILRVEFVSVI